MTFHGLVSMRTTYLAQCFIEKGSGKRPHKFCEEIYSARAFGPCEQPLEPTSQHEHKKALPLQGICSGSKLHVPEYCHLPIPKPFQWWLWMWPSRE